jgi:hypothetical protein
MYISMLKKLLSWVSQTKSSRILYNKNSAKKYKWNPSWFGAEAFDQNLINNIIEFQEAHGLKPDGLVGPMTYSRAFTNLENTPKTKGRILCNGKLVPFDWPRVKIDLIKDECYKKNKQERIPTMIVTHWDACLSAESCKKVLEKRNISTHFVIDNDGTIVQLADCNDITWHAGNRKVNNASIGIDFSNAYYTKYQKTYVKRGHGERPVLENSVVHGVKLKPHLGYYPKQIMAYKALLEFLHEQYGIALTCPTQNGRLLTEVYKPAVAAKFNGVVCHYHLTRKKIDTAGLELDKIIYQLKQYTSVSKD